MTKNLVVIGMLICSMVASCKDKVKTTVAGWWSIDTLYYRNYEIRTCLLGNWLVFNEDGSMKLPIPESRCSELVTEYNDKGDWEILSQDNQSLFLNIDSKNEMFGGKHQIVFRRDEQNSLLLMEISSDSLYVLCRKGMFNYNRNQELISDLEKMSGGKPFVKNVRLPDRPTDNYHKVSDDSTFLQTGWYYVTDTGLKRQLAKTEETYLINPEPIVTSKNILLLNVYKRNTSEKTFELEMQLDKEGTNAWSIATDNATSKPLAFIVDNTMVQVSIVNGRIDNGVTALTGYTKRELDSLKKIIEREH